MSTPDKEQQQQQQYRTILRGGRTVGYNVAEPSQEEDRSTAVVIFYALSGCSRVLSDMVFEGCRGSVISVDRPLCGSTSEIPTEPSPTPGCCASHQLPASLKVPIDLQRINTHAQDVIHILETENIQTVYLLGICIGHPYAVQLCRYLQSKNSNPTDIQLGGLTLVSPFVSTVCPHSWYMAKLGAWVPSSVLYGGTEAVSCIGSWLIPRLLRPSSIKKLITPEEEELAGWTEQDYQDAYQLLLDTTKESERAIGVEARLGVSKIWQFEVCDKFAVENGCGLVLENESKEGADNRQIASDDIANSGVNIRIHACRTDKLTSLQSIEWLSRRCYGNAPITVEEEFTSHEAMTFLGGPPRNPVLFHKIARDWGLRD